MLVPETIQTSIFPLWPLRFNGKTQQAGDSATDLRPGGRVNLGLAIVEECNGAIGEVETVRRRDGEAPFVPKPRDDGDVGTLS